MNKLEVLIKEYQELDTADVKWFVRTTPQQLAWASIISGFDISDLEIYPLDENGIPILPEA